MKLKTFLCLGAGLLFLAASAPAADNLTNTLQNGLFEEEANHNLAAAVRAYQAVIVRLDEDRKLAATAVFRLAECYRKLGQTNEANLQYQRVLRDFSDQTRLVELSRLVLDPANPALATAAAPGAAGSLDIVADGKVYHPATVAEAEQLRSIIATTKDSPDLVNAEDQNREHPLNSAARNDRRSVAEFLLDHGADVERGAGGMGPLQTAAEQGHKAMVQLLLDHGALVDGGRAPGFRTALELAARLGYIAVAEVLVAHGAKVNDTENSSSTPLIEAVAGNRPTMAKFLLDHGADLNAANGMGRTALHLAAEAGALELTRLLLDHDARVNAKDSAGNTPLLWAAQGDRPQYPVSGGWVINGAVNTPQDARARWDQKAFVLRKIVALLVGHHAEINATNHFGLTTLHWIALVNARDTMDLLLANKAEVNARDQDGLTPLHYAVRASQWANVSLLLDHGANPNAADQQGLTPLHYAVGDEKNMNIVPNLLEHGANPNMKDKWGRSSLSMLDGRFNESAEKIKALLIARGAVTPEPAPAAPREGNPSAALEKRYGITRPQSSTNASTATSQGTAPPLEIVADGKVYHPATEEEANQLRSYIAITKESPDLVNASENGTPRLSSAAQDGRLAVAEFWLDHESEAERNSQIAGLRYGPLQIAAERGHRAMVQLLLDHGFLVDGRSPGGTTPLESAASRGYLAVAEILVAHGAKVNDTEKNSFSPLFQAVARDQPAMAKFLIGKGADVNASYQAGRTALHLAAGRGFLELTRLLLDHKAKVNPRDSEGNTPLILAARGDQQTIRFFGERGRGPRESAAFDPGDARTRWYPKAAARTNIIAILVGNHAEVNATNDYGQTALHWIALVNAPDTMQLLLANKAEVNAADESGATPLSYAVESLEAGNVGILLEHGADANLKYKSGQTPLSWLAERGPNTPGVPSVQKIVSLLTSHGAVMPSANQASLRQSEGGALARLINSRSNTNASAADAPDPDHPSLDVLADGKVYHPATEAEAADIRAVESLRKDAPDLVSSASADGPSRLYVAAINGETALAEYLLAHGANVEEGDHFNGIPPIHAAARGGHKAIVALLLSHDAKVDAPDRRGVTALHLAAENGFTAVAETLLDHGADVNAQEQRATDQGGGATDQGAVTPLIMAARKGLKAMVELLLARGAKVNARESDGETALHAAVRSGYIPVSESLLAHAADINAKDRGGATPLILAVKVNQPAIAMFLMGQHADLNATNQSGQTALHLAAAAGSLQPTRALLNHEAAVDPRDRDGNTPLILLASGDRPPGGFPEYGEGRRGSGDGGFNGFRGRGGMARWNQGVGGSLTNIISLLVAHHAEVNATNQFGQTALHWIARSDAPDATEQLLASKAAVDARDTDGRTPLFNAVQSLRFANVSLLLDHGADPNAKDGKSLTPTVETVEEYKGRGFSRDEEETSQRIQALLVDRGGVLPKAVQSKPVATSGKLVVSVLGEVQKPGVVEFTPEKPLYLPEAIARAGGLNKVANARAIVINRHDKRIVFNLDEYLKNPGGNPAPALEDGDVIDIARTLY